MSSTANGTRRRLTAVLLGSVAVAIVVLSVASGASARSSDARGAPAGREREVDERRGDDESAPTTTWAPTTTREPPTTEPPTTEPPPPVVAVDDPPAAAAPIPTGADPVPAPDPPVAIVVDDPRPPVAVTSAAPAAEPVEVAADEPEPAVSVLGISQVRPADPGPPADPERPPDDRSTVATGLPGNVDLSPIWVAGNVGLGTLVLLLLVAASQLFNDTLKVHHDQIVARLSDGSSVVGRARAALAALPHPPALVSFSLVAAVMAVLADPSVAFSANTLAQMIGMSIAIALIVVVYDGTASRLIHRQTGFGRSYRLYPIAIAVAIGCLSLSRFMHVAPGVLYGLIVGVVFVGAVDPKLEGRAYARASAYLAVAALVALVVHRLVSPAASGASPSLGVIVVDTAAATLFVGGLQTVIVQLLPTRFVNGEKIAAWSRLSWFLLLAGSLALYLEFVVRPNRDEQSWANLWFVAGLVAFAVAFWGWCAIGTWRAGRVAGDRRLEESVGAP